MVVRSSFILGAGFGKRMRPLTDDRPKPMVEVAGKPLIDHVIDRLVCAGVDDFVVNVHYLASVLTDHLAKRTELNITISDESDELLDTGGGVFKALPHFRNKPFFIHNSDSIWKEPQGADNLTRMAERFDPLDMDGLLLLAKRDSSIGYPGQGDFFLNEDGRLRRRKEGETAPYVFAGVSIAHRLLFDGCNPGFFSLNQPWDRALAHGRLFGLILDGIWMHVGTSDAIGEAETCLGKTNG